MLLNDIIPRFSFPTSLVLKINYLFNKIYTYITQNNCSEKNETYYSEIIFQTMYIQLVETNECKNFL